LVIGELLRNSGWFRFTTNSAFQRVPAEFHRGTDIVAEGNKMRSEKTPPPELYNSLNYTA
jgi:hypothetical protein